MTMVIQAILKKKVRRLFLAKHSAKHIPLGQGYFCKFNTSNGVDLFAQYEHEKVEGEKIFQL